MSPASEPGTGISSRWCLSNLHVSARSRCSPRALSLHIYAARIALWPTYRTLTDTRPLRRRWLRADGLWCEAIRAAALRLADYACGRTDTVPLDRLERMTGRARRYACALRDRFDAARAVNARVEARRALLSDADRRAIAIGDLGGMRALASWQTRWRAFAPHIPGIEALMRAGRTRAQAVAELREALGNAPGKTPGKTPGKDAPTSPSTPPSAPRERLRTVHPDVAERLLTARLWGRRRTGCGRFALAPVPRLLDGTPPRRRPTVTRLTIDERRHGYMFAHLEARIREEVRADKAAFRETPEHARNHAPIHLTAGELLRGEHWRPPVARRTCSRWEEARRPVSAGVRFKRGHLPPVSRGPPSNGPDMVPSLSRPLSPSRRRMRAHGPGQDKGAHGMESASGIPLARPNLNHRVPCARTGHTDRTT